MPDAVLFLERVYLDAQPAPAAADRQLDEDVDRIAFGRRDLRQDRLEVGAQELPRPRELIVLRETEQLVQLPAGEVHVTIRAKDDDADIPDFGERSEPGRYAIGSRWRARHAPDGNDGRVVFHGRRDRKTSRVCKAYNRRVRQSINSVRLDSGRQPLFTRADGRYRELHTGTRIAT
jgi:hypothetical protein